MKTEQELRKQLAEVVAAIAQLDAQIIAARNQEYALKWALGEVEEPQVETTVTEGVGNDNGLNRS